MWEKGVWSIATVILQCMQWRVLSQLLTLGMMSTRPINAKIMPADSQSDLRILLHDYH